MEPTRPKGRGHLRQIKLAGMGEACPERRVHGGAEWRKKGWGWLLRATVLEYAKTVGISERSSTWFSENVPRGNLLGFR
jgi:hypothetical protein